MNKGADVLERSCLPAGKVFIREGEENARAYVVQTGEVMAFKLDGDRKIEVERLGPGTIIGEKCLVVDEPAKLSYEAVETTTVITITRQDFQKRLSRADKSIKTVLDHAVNKITYYENIEVNKALKNAEMDEDTRGIVQGLLTGLSEDKKRQYEDALAPYINGLVKEIKRIKESDDGDMVIEAR